ncbi:MAG TPA: carbon-nitrogen hydrolase family protein [Pyrinomonadaceae bacterium]|jgi:predicted amidohydrolase|nr:carbon-nitrogen hydrolase family protein [Pyrinomonadaceae bacterium]
MSKTNIACAQIDCVLGDPKTNREKIISSIREATERDAQLVIFPECALTGYAYNSLEEAVPFAEKIDGASSEAIAAACQQTRAYALVGFIESAGNNFYNAAMLVGPEGVVGGYRKVHLPFIGIDRFLNPGDRPFQVFELPFGKVGVNICYDISFPEPARVLKLMGAELIALITNWPTAAWRSPQFVANTRALENHVFYAAVDRVGTERAWEFIGRSKVVDCNGDTLAEASPDAEELLVVPVELQEANNNRIVNVAGAYEVDRMKDRRPEFYDPISERARAKTAQS